MNEVKCASPSIVLAGGIDNGVGQTHRVLVNHGRKGKKGGGHNETPSVEKSVEKIRYRESRLREKKRKGRREWNRKVQDILTFVRPQAPSEKGGEGQKIVHHQFPQE